MLSIIMPYHNEGKEFIQTTIDQIRETIDVSPCEIIVVDDGSRIPLSLSGVKVIRHPSNIGVGAAFDTGVAAAKYENIILMGCDIRFVKNQWASKMVKHIENNIGSFINAACVKLNIFSRCCNEDIIEGTCQKCGKPAQDNMDIMYRREKQKLNGATILMFHDRHSYERMGINPPKNVDATYRSIIDARWLPINPRTDLYEIPCLLGAFYGVKKSWYQFVDGWNGHRNWGALEPMISLKSWLFGGNCLQASDVEIGHIFKKVGTHGSPLAAQHYNRFLIAKLLFEDPSPLINFTHADIPFIIEAKRLIEENRHWISAKRREYRGKIIMDYMDLFNRFDIEYRSEESLINSDFIRVEANGIYGREDNSYSRHYTKSPYFKVWNHVAENITKEDSVCDIGCGPGQMMELLLDSGVKNYTGIDLSPIAVSKACSLLAKRPDQHKASLMCANVLNGFPIPKADKYVLVEILEHLNEDISLLEKIPTGKEVTLTVPSFLGGSHVRKFDTGEDVVKRYGNLFINTQVSTLPHGSGKIHILKGTRS